MGRLFEKEYCVLSELVDKPQHPCTFVLGGAKVSDAFLMMDSVLKSGIADYILTGGMVGNIMLLAQGKCIGKGSQQAIQERGYASCVQMAERLLKDHEEKICVPVDLAWEDATGRRDGSLDHIPDSITSMDIGANTTDEYVRRILASKTIFVNGPMGVFEQPNFEYGTKCVWEALGKTEGYTILGGGDSITATEKYHQTEKISYICTGGGALIRFLSGEELPVVAALKGAGAMPPVVEQNYSYSPEPASHPTLTAVDKQLHFLHKDF